MARNLHDHFFKRAKDEGFLSRAAFKLIEIDDRKRLVRPGDTVLDAGCAPGSWLQVLAQRVGRRGRVVGVDLKAVDERLFPGHVRIVQGDLTTIGVDELLGRWRDVAGVAEGAAASPDARRRARPPFDAIVSDMGPDTTGDPSGDSARSVRLCNALLDRCPELLRRGGNLAMKVYEGGDYPALLRRTQRLFDDAKGYKPAASRGESVEIYVVAHGWRGDDAAIAEGHDAAPARRRPSGGWKTPA
ncbi:MAG: RlmE family RNA methyltransferase [Phycisphaerales bacterium]|jgi:23S rRNA (uridine2552-2'-O)-methyltransferase